MLLSQTALLREVLCSDDYHVLHFDLRIAGFADLSSLYMSLSQQMQQYFEEIAATEGYKEFETEAWSFKVWFGSLLYRLDSEGTRSARSFECGTSPLRDN